MTTLTSKREDLAGAGYAHRVSGQGTDAVPADVLSGPDVARHVVRGGYQRATGFVAVNLLTAAAAVLLLRHLGVADFGRYGTVLALLAIVQGVSDAGLSLTGSRELSIRTGEERRELLAHLLGLRILLTGAGVVIAVAFAALAGYGETLVLGTALAGIGVFILSAQAAMLLPLVVELQNGRLTINEILRQAVLVACFVVLAVAGASLLPFFAAQLVAALVVLLATPLLLARHHFVRPRWTRERLRDLASMTFPLAISAVLSVVYFRVLVILVSLLEDDPIVVGNFVTSTRIIELFLALPGILVGIVLPVLSVAARDDAGRLRYVTLRTGQALLLLGVLLALVIGAGARPVVLLLGGEEYLGAVPVLQIQCIALVTIFVAGAWTTTLVGMGRARVLAICAAIGLVAVVALGVVLIPPLGAEGGAIAAVVADVIYCATIFVALRRAGLGDALPPQPFARIAAAALPALLIAIASPLPAAVDAVAVALLFTLLAVVFGAVPPELADRLRRRR
jgi:O-antigen/teichoic acid export membrane protein